MYRKDQYTKGKKSLAYLYFGLVLKTPFSFSISGSHCCTNSSVTNGCVACVEREREREGEREGGREGRKEGGRGSVCVCMCDVCLIKASS